MYNNVVSLTKSDYIPRRSNQPPVAAVKTKKAFANQEGET